MTKTNFGNSLDKSNNLNKGGGLRGMLNDKSKLSETAEEVQEVQRIPERQIETIVQTTGKIDKRKRQTPKDFSPKSFNILNDDYEFILKLQKYMRKQTGDDYTQNQAMGEAIALLKKKYPEAKNEVVNQ
jgi:hypothetical protein